MNFDNESVSRVLDGDVLRNKGFTVPLHRPLQSELLLLEAI